MARSLRRRARLGSPYPSARGRLSSMQWVVFLGMAFILPAVALAQSDGAAVPLTPWGEPDLQGIWDFRTATPLQRPAALAGKTVLTPEEAAAYERQAQERRADYDANPTVHEKSWLDYVTAIGAVATPILVLVLTALGWRIRDDSRQLGHARMVPERCTEIQRVANIRITSRSTRTP